jgi:hypothetical protein
MAQRGRRRPLIAVFAAAGLMAGASGALAAPTCQLLSGETARCGTAGAMPVGWTPSPGQILDRQAAATPGPSAEQMLDLALFLGGLFALIALMPEFDGWGPGDWDRQEGDDEDD